eukprot:scaffold194744_cov30-Tisochrysis_lutea.AAC.4
MDAQCEWRERNAGRRKGVDGCVESAICIDFTSAPLAWKPALTSGWRVVKVRSHSYGCSSGMSHIRPVFQRIISRYSTEKPSTSAGTASAGKSTGNRLCSSTNRGTIEHNRESERRTDAPNGAS